MNKRLLLRGSLRTLNRYRLRSFFMGLGVVVGVAALVVMRSIGSGAQQDMLAKIERLFSAGSIWIVNSSAAMQGGVQKLGQLSLEDVAVLEDEIEEIIDVSPILSTGGIEVRSPLANRSSLVIGTTEREESVGERSVVSGEFFTAAEVRSSARVALIGLTAAEALFGDEDPVGQQIQIAGAPFRIKGVLERFGADPHGLDRDDEIHVPITTLMRRIVNMDSISRVKILVSSTEVVEPTVDRITDVLRARHGLSDDAHDDGLARRSAHRDAIGAVVDVEADLLRLRRAETAPVVRLGRLPASGGRPDPHLHRAAVEAFDRDPVVEVRAADEIGRASCRERV